MPCTEAGNRDRLIAICEKTIANGKMARSGDAVLLAVSGGPDSVGLLHVFRALVPRYGYRLGIAHLNHGLRGVSSDRDAEFVERLAKTCGLPYYTEKIDLSAERNNLEQAGRDARYRFFDRVAERFGYDRIAVGHNREDNAELILMNLLRGSGPTGIGGIRPVRGHVIRPLIDAGRGEILDFLTSRALAYVEDQTNAKTTFRRNHIRHHLLPSLSYYNPRVVETLNRFGEVVRTEDDWIEQLVEPLFKTVEIARTEGTVVLSAAQLSGLHPGARRRVVRRALLEIKKDLRRIGFWHIDAVVALAATPTGDGELALPDRVRVLRRGSRLIVRKENKSLRSPDLFGKTVSPVFEYRVSREQAESATVHIRETDARIRFIRVPRQGVALPSGNSAALDWDDLEFPLVVRNARPGDRFRPFGMQGSQKLKSFFINNKIPATLRGRIPVVTSANRVIWVAGFRIDDRVRVSESTKEILKMTFIPANGSNTHMRAEEFEFECF